MYFPGVKVENIVVDKLVTYFDDYLMDMTNAVMLTEEELKKTRSDMTFLVRKRRLNHQPFKLSLDVVSDKTADSIVRIFLGPKKDNLGRLIDINRNRLNFVELDSFVYKLQSGKNVIVRDSMDMHNLVRDRVLTQDLWKRIESTNDVRDLFIKDLKNYMTGYPTRLLLPKGRVGGMDFMLYVIVCPLRMIDNVGIDVIQRDGMFDQNNKRDFNQWRSTVLLDKMPLGFPFDRHIDLSVFYTPNMKFVDVKIFHKKMACDMKTRWERFVLKNYGLAGFTSLDTNSYFTDVEVDTNMSLHRDVNRFRDDVNMDV